MNITKKNIIYKYSVTLFLYATLIVDLYRKIGGNNVETIRNAVYIISFVLILFDMMKSKDIKKILMMAFIVSFIFLISSYINSGYENIYKSTWILFISRLWPAFYIGRYTEDWASVAKCVSMFSWLALAYALIAILTPFDKGSDAYATIASNLVFVSFLSFYHCKLNGKIIGIIISVICFLAVLFLGTRSNSLGALISIVLIVVMFIRECNKNKQILFWNIIIISVFVCIFLLSSFIDIILDIFDNSRTVMMLAEGDFFDDSNRSDSFYKYLTNSLVNEPFKIYGFLGDRIYLAGSGADDEYIISCFSHNVFLELCMNFGLFPGIILSVYFLRILFKSFIKVFFYKRNEISQRFVFFTFLGVTFVDMMVSSSYLGSYYIWLLYGIVFQILNGYSYLNSKLLINGK